VEREGEGERRGVAVRTGEAVGGRGSPHFGHRT
jgi:hypothetical protein